MSRIHLHIPVGGGISAYLVQRDLHNIQWIPWDVEGIEAPMSCAKGHAWAL